MKYHPLREHMPVSGGENEHKIKRKKLKICNGCEALKLIPSIFVKSKKFGCLGMSLLFFSAFGSQLKSSRLNFL